jgi:hypothetical protein
MSNQSQAISDVDSPRINRGTSTTLCNSRHVTLDPDNILCPDEKKQLVDILRKHDSVFSPDIPGYNGAFCQFKSIVNMGPVQPPQRKGRLPQYARDKLDELQNKFDELEALGVFCRPEEAGVVAEYLNPSFLVKKANGGYRLVTAFAEVGRYCKPQPSLLPNVDSILRTIACWKYIIVSDLTSAFYQIPLSKESMKYCGVATPFRGVRVYTRSAMGMPGSETVLEELLCLCLGSLIQEGSVAKLADDLYCGGNTPKELSNNWQRILQRLEECQLRLSAKKTNICPKSTSILGWIWSEGSITASTHQVATLTTCNPPATVRGLRSFIGAYKVLGRVIPGCASIIAPLDDAIAGLQSQDKLKWSDNLHTAFSHAQESLQTCRSITLP